MLTVILVSGPPFDTALWTQVAKRFEHHGAQARCWPMFHGSSGEFDAEVGRLATFLSNLDGPTVLVGHGLANPLVTAAAHSAPLAGLVVSNGPLTGPDRLTRATKLIARAPDALALPFLRSSLGLRRMVVNPYVMDHDTTVAVCGPILANSDRRSQMRQFVNSLRWMPPPEGVNTLVCQGDSDPLSCCINNPFSEKFPTMTTINSVPGGRPLHPIERPWEIADRVTEWGQQFVTATQMS